MMKRNPFGMTGAVLAAVAAMMLSGSPAHAQRDPQLVSTSGSWSVFTFEDGGNRVCYMASLPTSSQPANVRRGQIIMAITHRPSERVTDEVSFASGYPFREGANVTVEIGTERFSMFTQGEMAWTDDPSVDRRLVDAIRRGDRMIVRGTSARGTNTVDTFSLSGSGTAHREMSRRCGIGG